MKDRVLDITPLVTLQRLSWLVFFVLFGVAGLMEPLGIRYAKEVADTAVIGVLAVTFFKTFLLARQFHRAGLKKLRLLSLLLALVLLSTIVFNYWVL